MKWDRHLPLKGAYNIRDLGGYPTGCGRSVAWRRFLRSDSLHRLAPGEAERLYEEGLRVVIDLRTQAELESAPNPFAAYPGVRFLNLPLFDDLSPEALSRRRAPEDHPLLSFYLSALRRRGEALRAIFTEIAACEEGALLFNCTAGKDRTGIVALLLLGLAEVPHEEIVADYALTADLIPDLVSEFLALSAARGGDVESYARLLESPAATAAQVLEEIEASYGGVRGYLGHIGLPEAAVARLHARLLAE